MDNFQLKNVSKKYGKNLVLDNISIDIPYGSIVGLLGLNGAGKTTLFEVITGFVNYAGVVGKYGKHEIAYMPTHNILDNLKTIKDNLKFYKDFMPNFNYDKALSEIEKLGLKPNKFYFKLSMGQKRIVAFVCAMNCDAKIYLFDEPFTNLDIIYRDYVIKNLIDNVNENKVFFVSSHDLLELENTLSHITILKDGKLSPLKSVEEIRDMGISVSEYYKGQVVL